MTRKPVDPLKPHGDRRSGTDRRKVDIAPPGRIDRRRSIDARKPDVVELDMSNSEWTALLPESPSTGKSDGKAA
jgi:hypothetical protein